MKQWEQLRRLNAGKYAADDLAGGAELADDIFHVKRTVVASWNSRGENDVFPPPVVKLRSGPVYSISEYVVAWNEWDVRNGNKSGFLDDEAYVRLHVLLSILNMKLRGDES